MMRSLIDLDEYYSELIFYLAKGSVSDMEAINRMDVFDFFRNLEIYEKQYKK